MVESLVKRAAGGWEEPPIEWILRPFQRFSREAASGGIVLLLCAVAAIVWANTPWQADYRRLWETHVAIGWGGFALDESLHFWINEALMAVFFFVVGLEIKREVVAGELASPRQAALPVVAAVGGMAVPAALFLGLNAGGEGMRGWGAAVSTDIAFSLGILAILGQRAPFSLKVFLSALAIADDLGAVVIIALFYSQDVAWSGLGVAVGLLAGLVLLNRLGVRQPLIYGLVGIGVWLAFLDSGIHPTIAGVAVAMTVPSRVRIDPREFLARGRAMLADFERVAAAGHASRAIEDRQAAIIDELETACKDVESPLTRLEERLHPWVAYFAVPLFALANAGVSFGGGLVETLSHPVTVGMILGLVVGKQVGITLFSWLAVRAGLTDLPQGVTWPHIYGVGWLGGVGFTMSLFVSALAFGDGPLAYEAKTGVFAASVIAGLGGWLILRWVVRAPASV